MTMKENLEAILFASLLIIGLPAIFIAVRWFLV
jgi:hypothetical protein